MDHKASGALDPKLKEAYDRIMGTPTDQAFQVTTKQQAVDSESQQPPVSHIPQPVDESITQKIQTQYIPHHTVSALKPATPHIMKGEAIGIPQTTHSKNSHHLIVKLAVILAVFLAVGYVFFWLKFFELPIPI